MKKIIFVLCLFLFFNLVNAGFLAENWAPPEEYNFDFSQPIIAGQDFTLYMEYSFTSLDEFPDEDYCILGGYKPGVLWQTYNISENVCENGGNRQDANMFKPPAGCTLKEYSAENTYTEGFGTCIGQLKTEMTLNCPAPGEYAVEARGDYCLKDSPYAFDEEDSKRKNLTFTVLSGTEIPPLYDFNYFWAIAGQDTNHFIKVWDTNETLWEEDYYARSFEVKVADDCEIISAGITDLSKNLISDDLITTIYSSHHKKFELPLKTKVFKNETGFYSGCEDTFISKANPTANYGSSVLMEVDAYFSGGEGYYKKGLIRFKDLGIPVDALIDLAELDLYINSFTDSSPTDSHNDLFAYHLWKYDWKANEANWNNWMSGNFWKNAGTGLTGDDSGTFNTYNGDCGNSTCADKKSTPEDSSNLVSGISNYYLSSVQKTLNVTNSLQLQLNENPIKYSGWILEADWQNKYTDIASCNSSADKRPRLKVRYNEPNYTPLNFEDVNQMHFYADIKCNKLGSRDFNITITDAGNNSTEINSNILDINSFEVQSPDSFIEDQGPPGIDLKGPAYMGMFGVQIFAQAFGLRNYETDTNHYFAFGSGGHEKAWVVCKDGLNNEGLFQCILDVLMNRPTKNYFDTSCIMPNSQTTESITKDYQKITAKNDLVCDTPGHRTLIYYGTDPQTSKLHADKVDVYVLDFRADLNAPYYAIIDENSTISGKAVDNEPAIADIQEIKWIVYSSECGPIEEDCQYPEQQGCRLTDSEFNPTNPVNEDVTSSAIIKCSKTGKKPINMATIIDKKYYPDSLNVLIRGDTYIYVIRPDSLRMDSFEVIPPKVPKNNLVEFRAVITNKMTPSEYLDKYKVDLNTQVGFEVFDEEGNFIAEIFSETKITKSNKQQEFSVDFDTSITEILENNPYRVVATAYLVSGSGPIKDKQPINDVLEDHFWVLPAENKLENLPETNFIGIILILISVIIILQGTKK